MNRITAIRVAAQMSRTLGLQCKAVKGNGEWTIELRTCSGLYCGEIDLPADGSIPPVPEMKQLREIVQDVVETTYAELA